MRRGEAADEARLSARLDTVARVLADVASHGQLVVTHGNGPQVGLLALKELEYLGHTQEGTIAQRIERLTGAILNGFDPRRAKAGHYSYNYNYRYEYKNRQD